MALPTTQGLTTQLQNESVRNQPTTPMDGNVTRPMLIADLLKAMRQVAKTGNGPKDQTPSAGCGIKWKYD
mgnify:CR=1 FL=1